MLNLKVCDLYTFLLVCKVLAWCLHRFCIDCRPSCVETSKLCQVTIQVPCQQTLEAQAQAEDAVITWLCTAVHMGL